MQPSNALQQLTKAPYLMVDPGASGTITIDRQLAVIPVVTATAEARTLAAPTKAGMVCTVVLDTDGGNLTLTVTGGYNQNGDTSITYADAGDWVSFMSVKTATTYTWRVLGSEGTTLAGGENALTGVTAGTAAASKAVVLDSSLGIAGLGIVSIGAKADTAISNVVLATATPRALGVFADDDGANIADDVKCIEGRMLLTIDQSAGSIRGVQGHLKALSGIDVTTGIYTALQGYVEFVATRSIKTGATLSCIDASLELGAGATTVDSGGEMCGLHVETTGAGTITNSGTCAGVLIDMASGAAKWPDGILIDGASVIMGMRIGKFAGSAATTSAVPFATAQDVYSDGQLSTMEVHGSSASNLTSAYSAKCIRARHVVSGTGLTIAHETYGIMGQLVAKGSTLTHLHSGLIGTFEGHTSGVVINGSYTYGAAAVMARVGGGAAIVATKALCGVVAFWNGAAIASGTGTIAFGADDSGTTLWAVGLGVSRATALFAVPAAGTAPTTSGTVAMNGVTSEGYITVSVGGAAKKVYYFA